MWNQYPEYKSRAVVADENQKKIAQLLKKNPKLSPIQLDDKKLAKTWWGMAWNKNLESYADYASRIGRGRSYVRSSAIFDLQIQAGIVKAMVQGSRNKPYEITIHIEPLSAEKWQHIVNLCGQKIANMETLAKGEFPENFAQLFTDPVHGLFPHPKEIKFDCTCPDWASMCKHVAAALYGVGAKFDRDPTLLFTLRDIHFEALLKKSIDEKMQNMLKNAGKPSKRVMNEVNLDQLFGLN